MNHQNEENVWYLRVLGEMHSRSGFVADELSPYAPGDAKAIFRKYYLTEEIDPTDFPNRYWLDTSRAGTRGKVLPPAHLASDFLCVSHEFLKVLFWARTISSPMTGRTMSFICLRTPGNEFGNL